jgi:hypothetical protein
MVRRVRAASLLALVLSIGGCGKDKGGDATAAAQALLAAVQTGDAKTFEAHLDRAALRADLRAQLQAVAAANGLDVAGGAADFTLDRMIAPEAFHLVREDGAQLTTPPTLGQIAPLMTATAKDRACLHDLAAPQRCVLTFARGETGWRLVAMPAADLRIVVPPEPPPKA